MRFSFKRIRARAGRRETLKTDEQGKVVICRAVRYGTVRYGTVQYSTGDGRVGERSSIVAEKGKERSDTGKLLEM